MHTRSMAALLPLGNTIPYCHEALHLNQEEKLQKSGYKAKVEKWDTDSDSGGETEEEDLMV